MYRYLAILCLVLVPGLVTAAAAIPAFPCGRAVYTFGDATLLGEGVRMPGSSDLAARMHNFFERMCPDAGSFENIAERNATLVDRAPAIVETVLRNPRSIVFVHFPFTDIEAEVAIDRILRAYGKILAACASSGSTCIIGGQQPVNSFVQQHTDRQRELERRASAAFGPSYMSIFVHFESESGSRRLMLPLDAGNGRFVDDFGHELLFKLYRRRLLELTSAIR